MREHWTSRVTFLHLKRVNTFLAHIALALRTRHYRNRSGISDILYCVVSYSRCILFRAGDTTVATRGG